MKAIDGKDTLCFEPVDEVNTLRGQPILQLKNVTLTEANEKLQVLRSMLP